ncbi:MAG: hypothetical protein K1Y36_10690 [Blastocatellia bacterium]|nr:hypothetical protein [Blastocatellia bacterium]
MWTRKATDITLHVLIFLIAVLFFTSTCWSPPAVSQIQSEPFPPFEQAVPLPDQAPVIPFFPNSGTAVSPRLDALPQFEEELKTDDGTVESGALGDGLLVVNRLTPSGYPVKLDRIRIQWDGFSGQPSPIGAQVRLLAFLDPTSAGRPVTPVQFVVDQTVTIPSVGGFVDFPLPNGPTLAAGDLYVGFQAPNPATGVIFSADTNGPQRERAFFSINNGTTFAGPLTFSDGQKANILIRAVVSTVNSGTTEELRTDDGTIDGRGLLDNSLLMVNRLTPSSYPVTLQKAKIMFVAFQGQPSPIGKSVQLVVFSDPQATGKPPANPTFQVQQNVVITRVNDFIEFDVPPVSIPSGDVYVGYGVGNPHDGVGFGADTNGTPQHRAFFSTNGGASFSGPLQLSDGTQTNLLIRAMVSRGGSGGDTQAPTVQILAPNGGETLSAGSTFGIQWTSGDNTGVTGHSIALSTDGGATFPSTVASGLAGFTQRFDWTVPTTATTTGRIKVTASDAAGNSSFDVSDQNFRISTGGGGDTQAPTVNLLVPNGGETLLAGSTFGIQWTSGDNTGVAAHSITLSTDSGATFPANVTTGLAGYIQRFDWTVPNPATTTARLKVTASDAAGNSGFDLSDGNFTIKAGNPNLPTVSINTTTPTITELGIASFVVSRTDNLDTAVTVRYTVGGSAVSGTDFIPLKGTVTIPAKMASTVFGVMPVNNPKIDPDRTIALTLASDVAYRIGAQATASVTIQDNDKMGSGTCTPAEGGSINTEDGASVTLPPGYGDGQATVSLTRIGKAPKNKGSTEVRTVSWTYHLGISYVGAFPIESEIVVTVPLVEKVFPAEWNSLGFEGVCYDEKTKTWVTMGRNPIADREKMTVTFLLPIAKMVTQGTTAKERFGPYQTGYTNTLDFKANGVNQSLMRQTQEPGSNFIITYYEATPATQYSVKADKNWNNGTSCSGTTGTADTNFVRDLDAVLNSSYRSLLALPQSPFGELSLPQKAKITKVSGGEAGESPLGGPLIVSNSKMENCQDLKNTATHELIHVFQGQYYNNLANAGYAVASSTSNQWFIEASANHFAALATGMGDAQKRTFYSDRNGSISDYLSVPITSGNDNSMYAVAHFLDWLADRYSYDIVGVTIRKRSESFYDLTNLNNAIREFQTAAADPTNQLGLAGAFPEYVKYVMTHPDGTAEFNQDIKNAMYGNTFGSQYTTLPAGLFTDSAAFMTLQKPLRPYSAVYLSVAARNASNALLVIDTSQCSGAPMQSLTYDLVGKTEAAYTNQDPVDKNKVLGGSTPWTVPEFGKGQKKTDFEQVVINGSPVTGTVNINYYILVPPKITKVSQGALLWEYSGFGKEKGKIPTEFLKGYDVYSKTLGKKLNSSPVPLQTSGVEQSFSSADITGGSTDDYIVTIVDKFDNSWPLAEVKPKLETTKYATFDMRVYGTFHYYYYDASKPGDHADYDGGGDFQIRLERVPITWTGNLHFTGTHRATNGTEYTFEGTVDPDGHGMTISASRHYLSTYYDSFWESNVRSAADAAGSLTIKETIFSITDDFFCNGGTVTINSASYAASATYDNPSSAYQKNSRTTLVSPRTATWRIDFMVNP